MRNLVIPILILFSGTRAWSSEGAYSPVREPVYEISENGETFAQANITAYTSSADECGNALGITKSGEPARDGIVACNFLPLGTRIKIPDLFGEKEFIVKDRMAKRKRNFIDIWVSSKKRAFQIGRSRMRIVILG
ncbi:MAG: hypothetical protein WCO21_01445 [bacterium]